MKLALFCNLKYLKFTKVCINLEKHVIIWTLCGISLFEFIRVEGGGAKFMKHIKRAQAIKGWEPLR
jgi:hypothetical protein